MNTWQLCCAGQLKQFRKGSGPQNVTDGHVTPSRQLANSPQSHAMQVRMCGWYIYMYVCMCICVYVYVYLYVYCICICISVTSLVIGHPVTK